MEDSKPLRIAIICDPISDAVAGAVVSTARFATYLKEHGHEVLFIAARSTASPRDDLFMGMRAYRFRSLPIPRSDGEWRMALPTSREIKNILTKEQIDLVHIMLPMPSALAAHKAAKWLSLPVIIHSHAQPENILLNVPTLLFRDALAHLYYKLIYWFFRKADGIVYPTEFARKLFSGMQYGGPSVVISNGVDTGRFKPTDASAFRTKLGLAENDPHLVYAGRLHPEKSLPTFIKAVPRIVERYPTAKISIVGSGYLRSELERLAGVLGVSDAVHFHGRVNDEDLVLAYNSADLFVMPSLAELEGMVVLEAMACGKPILVADSPQSASTHFVQGNGSLFRSEDPESLAAEALSLLADRDQLQAYGTASLELASQRSLSESGRRLVQFYRKLLNL